MESVLDLRTILKGFRNNQTFQSGHEAETSTWALPRAMVSWCYGLFVRKVADFSHP